ncbi:MAG: TetR/AcrR family transcriptional regulator [Actinomycetales bacterium]
MSQRPTTLTAKGSRRREQLLEATLEVIAERGYAGASQRHIAHRAGVSAASTHYFFSSMEELAREAAALLLQRRVSAYEDLFAALADEGCSPAEWIGRVAAMLDGVSVPLRVAQFEIYLNATRHEDLAVSVRECVDRLRALTVTGLRGCGVVDPQAWAGPVLALGDGLALQRLAGPVPEGELERALQAVILVARMGPAERARAEVAVQSTPGPG